MVTQLSDAGEGSHAGTSAVRSRTVSPATAGLFREEEDISDAELFGTDKMGGRCQYEVHGPENFVGISLRGIAGSERTRSRCSDSPRSAAHSGREAPPTAEPQPRVGHRVSPLGR